MLAAGVWSRAEDVKPAENPPKAIAITELKPGHPVDFENEVLPILKNNCLACHNQTTTKGDLILETPQTILKGGESGPAVVPGRSAESLLLQLASHQKRPTMPPKDNKVAASDLTPEELGLLKLWIEQGAKGEVHVAGPVEWCPLPEGLNPIFAVALTSDGQFAACGRANQIFIYHVPSGQLATRLTDAQLLKAAGDGRPGVAHLDLVHALAFSPDGTLLASGGYREVKLWRRPRNVQKFNLPSAASNAVQSVATSPDGKWLATGGADSTIKIWDLGSGKLARQFAGHEKAVAALKFSPSSARLGSGSADKRIRVWNVADGSLFAETNTVTEVNALTWLGSDQQIASGGADNLIRLWQLPESTNGTFAVLKELKGHTAAVTSLDTVDGKQIVSGSSDGSVRQWNMEKGEMVRELKHGGPVTAVVVRADGKRFASAGSTNVAKLWDAESGKQIAELKGDRYAQEFAAESERALTLAGGELLRVTISF